MACRLFVCMEEIVFLQFTLYSSWKSLPFSNRDFKILPTFKYKLKNVFIFRLIIFILIFHNPPSPHHTVHLLSLVIDPELSKILVLIVLDSSMCLMDPHYQLQIPQLYDVWITFNITLICLLIYFILCPMAGNLHLFMYDGGGFKICSLKQVGINLVCYHIWIPSLTFLKKRKHFQLTLYLITCIFYLHVSIAANHNIYCCILSLILFIADSLQRQSQA